MRRGCHSRNIPQAPPCGLCFLGKWLMSYDLKRNLGLRPTNRPLLDLKGFSATMPATTMTCGQPARTEVTSDTMHKFLGLHRSDRDTRHSDGTVRSVSC